MKKIWLVLVISFCLAANSNAQHTKPKPCDSIQEMYDMALVVLDSVLGNQISQQKVMDSLTMRINKIKKEVNDLLKYQAQSQQELKAAKSLIADQLKMIDEQEKLINEQETKIKRLSTPAKKRKQGGP